MLELLWISLSSFLAALSGAVVPGPVFALVLSSSIKGSRFSGPLIVLGHLLIECAVILMIFMGFQSILQSREVKMVIGYIGGVLLASMGLKLIFNATKIEFKDTFNLNTAIKPNKALPYKLILLGFLASGSNPHFFLWWLTTGLPIMISSISIAGKVGFLSFLIGHAAADLSWFSFISYLAYKGGKIISGKHIQVIFLMSAALLISFAIYIIVTSIT